MSVKFRKGKIYEENPEWWSEMNKAYKIKKAKEREKQF